MHPWEKDHWLPGVLSNQQVKKLIDSVYIDGVEDFEKAADYSSIDLSLSSDGYKMILGSVKPCGHPTEPYRYFLDDQKFAKRLSPDSEGCFVLRANECYVFCLSERLITGKLLGSNIFGMATAKSSVGRVDVIARLIVDGMLQYEYLNPEDLKNSTGEMFLEIIPISFDVCVKPGISLSQLRLFYGHPDESLIRDKNFIKGVLHESAGGEGFLTVDLSNTSIGGLEVAAFRANNEKVNEYIDLWKREKGEKPAPWEYWCFDHADEKDRLTLRTGAFYLLRSKERIALPSRVAVYARPMDETLGDMRIHYAGFVHPYFGEERNDGKTGTPLIFEVRAHNVNVNLDDGERLARLLFYRMSEQANKEDDPNYNSQELELSKFFGEWPEKLEYLDRETGKVKPA